MITELQNKLARFKKLFPSEKITNVKQMEGAENHILEINDVWIIKVPKNFNFNNLDIEAR